MSSPATASGPEKLCGTCFLPAPIESFRRRQRGRPARMNQCRECHRQAERVRRALAATKRNRRRVAGGLTRLREARSDGQVRALCGEMVRRLGGVSAFMEAWTGVVHRDFQKGGYAACRHIDSILKLAQYCEQNRPDYSQFTDEQLEEAVWALGGELPPE